MNKRNKIAMLGAALFATLSILLGTAAPAQAAVADICVTWGSQSGAYVRVEFWDNVGSGHWVTVHRGECASHLTSGELFEFYVPYMWRCKSDWGHVYVEDYYGTSNLSGRFNLTCSRVK